MRDRVSESPGRRDGAAVFGWDIGGANLKAVRLDPDGDVRVGERPFEIWKSPVTLADELAALAHDVGPAAIHAATMTAELADCFATKRQGVLAVVSALEQAFPAAELSFFSNSGRFFSIAAARQRPLAVAGANWCASARWLALEEKDGAPGILLDVGSTTTDVVPFSGGEILARGRIDPERLVEGEFVYTGATRTPLEALLVTVPLRGRECPVAAEHFAIAADAHLWLRHLQEEDYRCSTPDGGRTTRAGAAARLARLVCADLEMLDDREITAIAERAAEAQVDLIERALSRVADRFPAARGMIGSTDERRSGLRVFTAGSGAWVGEAAARRVGLPVEPLEVRLGDTARVLPAFAAAQLRRDGDPGFPRGAKRARHQQHAGRGVLAS